VSLDGQDYFYQNPLENDGTHRRQPWFGCACCPPNVARTLASLPGYVYSVSDEGAWVHLYAQGQAELPLPDGQMLRLVQRTSYPWSGEIGIEIESAVTCSLFLRVPAWCEAGAALRVNGVPFEGKLVPETYVEVRRAWRTGDRVTLDLPMPVRRVACHPYVSENAGRVALMRGPILYCLEEADNPGLDLRDVVLSADASWDATFEPDTLGGVVVLQGEARVDPLDEAWAGRLYGTAGVDAAPGAGRAAAVTAIPYYAWANRAPGAMRVWVRRERG
jgi:DUF1680 family protein